MNPMFQTALSAFALLHMLGDFYFQTGRLSRSKENQYGYVALHGAIYAAVFFIGAAAMWSAPVAWAAGGLSLAHFAVDSLKYFIARGRGSGSTLTLYAVDQLVHLACIAAAAAVFAYQGYAVSLIPALGGVVSAIVPEGGAVLGWACVLVAICKPANITIKHLARYRPAQEERDTLKNAGAFIGILERIIIALFLAVGQYAAIGLVLTAKSVARYDKISRDQAFAEYYLLGTLLSTLFVIAAVFVFI